MATDMTVPTRAVEVADGKGDITVDSQYDVSFGLADGKSDEKKVLRNFEEFQLR